MIYAIFSTALTKHFKRGRRKTYDQNTVRNVNFARQLLFTDLGKYFILLFQVRSNDLGTEERKATEVLLVSLRPTKLMKGNAVGPGTQDGLKKYKRT